MYVCMYSVLRRHFNNGSIEPFIDNCKMNLNMYKTKLFLEVDTKNYNKLYKILLFQFL